MIQERFADIGDGARLHVLEAGAGKPIVLLHGWPSSANAWRPQLGELSSDHRVLALDLRGFGNSSAIENPTMARLALDVKEFIDGEGLSDVLLIGWSMGGCVAMSYYEQFGAYALRGLGIVDVSPKLWPEEDWPLGEGTPFSREEVGGWSDAWEANRRSMGEHIFTIGFKHVERHAAIREELIEDTMRTDPQTGMVTLLDAFRCDYRPVLPTIEVPVLLLYGAASTSAPKYVRDYLEQVIPDATLVVFEESGHCMMIEETAKFNGAIDEFAKRI